MSSPESPQQPKGGALVPDFASPLDCATLQELLAEVTRRTLSGAVVVVSKTDISPGQNTVMRVWGSPAVTGAAFGSLAAYVAGGVLLETQKLKKQVQPPASPDVPPPP